MAMLDRPKVQKQVLNGLLATIIGAILVFGILLIHVASQVAKATSITMKYIQVGPLHLMQIQKVPVVSGGYQISMKFLPGLAIYFLIWMLAGAIVIFVQKKVKSSNNTN